MRLIIGGVSNGKLSRIYELGYLKEDILDCTVSSSSKKESFKVLYKLNFLIDSLMKQGISPLPEINSLISKAKIEVIVCDELGSGVVPLNRYERDYRECVGRICCEIASRANIVERVYCGITTVIKTDEN